MISGREMDPNRQIETLLYQMFNHNGIHERISLSKTFFKRLKMSTLKKHSTTETSSREPTTTKCFEMNEKQKQIITFRLFCWGSTEIVTREDDVLKRLSNV